MWPLINTLIHQTSFPFFILQLNCPDKTNHVIFHVRLWGKLIIWYSRDFMEILKIKKTFKFRRILANYNIFFTNFLNNKSFLLYDNILSFLETIMKMNWNARKIYVINSKLNFRRIRNKGCAFKISTNINSTTSTIFFLFIKKQHYISFIKSFVMNQKLNQANNKLDDQINSASNMNKNNDEFLSEQV